MKITITGASGFVGRRLIDLLLAERHEIHALSRSSQTPFPAGVRVSGWDPTQDEPPAESLDGADAIVHLAGEPVAQKWTPLAKEKIRDSRVQGTRLLVNALSTRSQRPAVLISSSAIGYYGSRGDEILTEASRPGKGFLPDVCIEWEKQADLAESLGIRVLKIRTGIVLGRNGGALAKMLPPFRRYVGGRLGSGKQWMSWIHIDDLANMMRHAIVTPAAGPWNGVAPKPVTNAEFTNTLASELGKPAIFPVPGFALRLMFGEMSEILLGSQRVAPKAAEAAGFEFQYSDLASALKSVLRD